MIDPKCCRCRKELDAKGGVLLMPPDDVRLVGGGGLEADMVPKLHLCVACTYATVLFLAQGHDGTISPFAPPNAACSFCSKKVGESVSDYRPETLVRYIIRGPNALICDSCVSLCEEILNEKGISDRPPCTIGNCGHLRQLDAIVDLLGMPRGTRSVLDELRARASAETWEDVSDEWTEAISAAHPARSDSHEEYGVAMKMVGHRRSKGTLVALVNWLLVRLRRAGKEARDDVSREE